MIKPGRIKEIRKLLNMDQSQFAQLIGVCPLSIPLWESGINTPDGPTTRVMAVMEVYIEDVENIKEVSAMVCGCIAKGYTLESFLYLLESIFKANRKLRETGKLKDCSICNVEHRANNLVACTKCNKLICPGCTAEIFSDASFLCKKCEQRRKKELERIQKRNSKWQDEKEDRLQNHNK